MPTDLVAIPSASQKHNHLRRNVAIGMAIGTALFLLVATLAIRRWRRRSIIQPSDQCILLPTTFQEPRASNFSPVLEIGHNSEVGPYSELPDSAKAKVELLNEQAPSGSGYHISEMAEALAPVSHELRANRSSSVIPQTRTANSCKILASTKMLSKGFTSLASSDGAPCVETVMSASTQRNGIKTDRASIVTSSLEAEIYSSYIRKSLDLNRSLPPTPISESPQVSPVVAKFDGRFPFYQRPQIANNSIHGSMPAFDSPGSPISTYPATLSKHRRAPKSVLSMGLETVEGPSRVNRAPTSQELRSYRNEGVD